MKPMLSVVVPVFRNADTVPAVPERIRRAFAADSTEYEIIFVDDACPAGSLAVLTDLAQHDPRVLVLALAQNVGQHQAVLAGLAHARGDWVAIMDADLQDPPEALPALLERAQAGYEAVFAGRRGRYESTFRLLTSRLYKRIMHAMVGVPADAGVFCVISQRLARKLVDMNDGRPSLVAMIGCARPSMTSVPVARAQRPSGQSAYDTRRRLQSALRGMAWVLRWKMRPQRPAAAPLPALTVFGQRSIEQEEGP
jgi:glycosyltransferase involved in cell wall biosynthesis